MFYAIITPSMPYPYSSGYHFSSGSSPSLPGAWSSAWSLPHQYPEYEMTLEMAEVKRVGDIYEPLSSFNPVDLGCSERTEVAPLSDHTSKSRSKSDPPGALLACQLENSFLSLESQSTLAPPQDDAISDGNTSPGGYSRSYSFCSSHRLSPLAFESNVSLETLSLCRVSVSSSPMNYLKSTLSRKSSFSSELGVNNQEINHSCKKFKEIARPSFDNNTLPTNPNTFLDKTNFLEHSITGQDYSSDFCPHPLLLLSQPDGNNTWTLSLDPKISRSGTISDSSLESKSSSLLSSSASNYDDEAIATTRGILPSISSMPRYNWSFLSLPPSQVDIVEFSAASHTSMIVSSTSSVQQRHDRGRISVPFCMEDADLHHDLSHDFPRSTTQDSIQQPTRSSKLVKKSKDIFGRLKRLFTPKETRSEDIQAHTAHPNSNLQAGPASGRRFFSSPRPWSSYQRYRLSRSIKSTTPSFWQSFSPEDSSHTNNNVDEKYTYEYHARPKTLKEIKSQRRLSLPMAFVGTLSRATSSTKRNVATSAPRSQSRPMSMYIAPQSGTLLIEKPAII